MISIKLTQATVSAVQRGIPILQKITMTVSEGECVALLGESGAGKTVLGHTLVGHLPKTLRITEGRVERKGDSSLEAPVNWHMIALPQYPARWLPPLVSAREIVSQALTWATGTNMRSTRQLAEDLLIDVGFPRGDSFIDRLPSELSGGMCQRVALAVAIANKPAFCFLDEPTSGFDPSSRYGMLLTLQGTRNKLGTVIFATHDLEFALAYASRFVVLSMGEMVFDGNRRTLLEDKSEYLRELVNI